MLFYLWIWLYQTKISCNNNKARGNVKIILHKFKADFPEGCVTALMGPSGAGML
jgi:ABC-type multidrug transport system ATPase subunit